MKNIRMCIIGAVVVSIVAIALLGFPGSAESTLMPGEKILPGQYITSNSGKYVFVYQTDGNLVLYSGQTPLWSSDTAGKTGDRAIMQNDGNLVIYNGVTPIWATGTEGHSNSHLEVQDDGNVVIYTTEHAPIWATNTWTDSVKPANPVSLGKSQLGPGEKILPGQYITSNSGKYVFVYQTDGNLVLYSGQTPLWSSDTAGKTGDRAIMQNDGNLVIYNGVTPIWATGTEGHSNSHLEVQDDGNVVIYTTEHAPIWATNTWVQGSAVIAPKNWCYMRNGGTITFRVNFANTGTSAYTGNFHCAVGVDTTSGHFEMPYNLQLSNLKPGDLVSEDINVPAPYDPKSTYWLLVTYVYGNVIMRDVKLFDKPLKGGDIIYYSGCIDVP